MPAKKVIINTEPIIYVGPNTSGLVKGTTYINGYPKHIEADLKAFPTLAKLFVKASELSSTLANLENDDSAENAYFNAAKKYFNNEVK